MDGIVQTATTTFNSTIGFELSTVVDWMIDLLTLVLGTGLAVLEELIPVIVVLTAISAVVYLLYRAFLFFRR